MARVRSLVTLLALISGGNALASASREDFKRPHVPGQLIVKFKTPVSKSRFFSKTGAKEVHVFESNKASLLSFGTKFSRSDLFDVAQQLEKRSDVVYVEPNYILSASNVPNDPLYKDQYALKNTETAGADISMESAWKISTGSKDVMVGVIDTGIDYSHPDLKANMWTNPGESGLDANGKDKATNGVDDDNNGYIDDVHGWDFANNDNNPMDDQGHGSHCAGVIGASVNNGEGIAGMNHNVTLVGIKFLTGSGSGSLDNAVKSIEYGTKIGVTMTSNSWGGGGFSQTMKDAIDAANAKGILFIAAAGNDNSDNDKRPSYPASYASANIISVAANDNKDGLAKFTNYGATSVHLSAPGVDIISTVPGGKYKKMSGTSMAAPHVSGAAALIKAAFPGATASQIKMRLLGNADFVPQMQGKVITGGRLNMLAALDLDSVAPGAVANMNVVKESAMYVNFAWDKAGDDGDAGEAFSYYVRTSQNPIVTEEDWNNASAQPGAFGRNEEGRITYTLGGLVANSSGFLAVRAVDNVGNVGSFVSRAWQTTQLAVVYSNPAENLDSVVVDGTWGMEVVEGRGNVFSDSPEGEYKNSTDTSLTLESIPVTSTDALLGFETFADIESNYDHGYVEISVDGGTWKEVKKFTGKTEWSKQVIGLNTFLTPSAKFFKIRFRIKSDNVVTKQGWMIDNVEIYAAN